MRLLITSHVIHYSHAGRLYAYETADACEDDSLGYKIGDTLVSDFVFPAWFEESAASGAQFDYQKKIKKPFELLPGGYIGYFDVGMGTGWQQLTAKTAPPGKKVDFRLLARPTNAAALRLYRAAGFAENPTLFFEKKVT